MQLSTGRGAGPDDQSRERGGDRLPAALGWFSIGLGAAQVVAPAAVDRLVGITPTGRSRALMRGVGLQELSVGAGILASDRPDGWLWSRVAGDVTHLMLLGAALRSPDSRRRRVTMAIAAVAAVAAVDLIASVRAGRASDGARQVMRSTTAITINRPPEEVYRYWRDLHNLPRFMFHLQSVDVTADGRSHWVARGPTGTTVEWDAETVQDTPNELIAWRSLEGADVDNAGAVQFRPAPGGGGTEVTVDLEVATPGGEVGRALAKVAGEHPEQQVKDALRRLKQVLEAGEVVRSDGSPDGTRTQRQWRQPPARPPV
ncbi:MAG: SRPBCC family protein [Actinomycetota bacterium]|nr:SRPBCC family protein [Actinomycetota bacterium]